MNHTLGMKKLTRSTPFAVLGAMLLALAGCYQERLVWSPDGRHLAIVVESGGLHIADAEGVLADTRLADVYLANWLEDSRRLIVATSKSAKQWEEIASVLDRDELHAVGRRADDILTRMQDGAPWGIVTMHADPLTKAAVLALKSGRTDELRQLLDDSTWQTVQRDFAVEYSEVGIVTLKDGKLESGSTRLAVLGDGIVQLRIAPGGHQAAVSVQEGGEDADTFALYVVALEGAVRHARVASESAAYPDWSPAGDALIYWSAVGESVHGDDFRLGALVRREVHGGPDSLVVAEEKTDLAGGLFSPYGRVRTLADGRILFDASEISLPLSAADAEATREQLFALDPVRQSTLVRLIPRREEEDLPGLLAFFEPSPDGTQVVFGDMDGRVSILTIASGDVDAVQNAGGDSMQGAPVWRQPGEICYFRRNRSDEKGADRPGEFILRRGESETVVSRSWPKEFLEDVLK